MRKITFASLLFTMLWGCTILVSSCKRDLESQNDSQLNVAPVILEAKLYVESLIQQQGTDAFVKKMGFSINWDKAIIDSAGNIRVPMYFDLDKLQPKDGKQGALPKTKNVFELYIKKDKEQNEVSIIQFMHLKGKYYPLRFSLDGRGKTKIGINSSMQDIKVLSKKENQMQSSFFNKTMITESAFMELIQDRYGQSIAAVVIYECPLGTMFEPTTCLCDFPENVYSGTLFPEIFMAIIDSSGSYQLVSYPFSFHPSEITDDPEYPDEPIGGNGNVDCAGVANGSAYEACCGCIGGTTGITDCSQLGDNTNSTPTASIVQISPSNTAISVLGINWGLTYPESVDIEIDASLSNCTWTAVLINAKGSYSLQARLISGVSEVGGTNSTNFCDQVRDLKNLGNISGVQWYMLAAVQAHENEHLNHFLPAMQNSLNAIQADVNTLTVPSTGQSRNQAILQLKSLSSFSTVKNNAYTSWFGNVLLLVANDHNNGGVCDIAEHAVVDPVGISICNNASFQIPAWPACSNCPY